LGCDPFDPAFALDRQSSHSAMDGLVNLALAQREAARARRDFAAADAIRDQILELGILIEDTPAGPRWTLAR
jgi:cysteinyl-tRNA synthetase